jgi:hypothetical protein
MRCVYFRENGRHFRRTMSYFSIRKAEGAIVCRASGSVTTDVRQKRPDANVQGMQLSGTSQWPAGASTCINQFMQMCVHDPILVGFQTCSVTQAQWLIGKSKEMQWETRCPGCRCYDIRLGFHS